jgi:hypothetical protein
MFTSSGEGREGHKDKQYADLKDGIHRWTDTDIQRARSTNKFNFIVRIREV